MLAQVDVEFASVGTPRGHQSVEAKRRLTGVTSTSGRADAKSGELKADPPKLPSYLWPHAFYDSFPYLALCTHQTSHCAPCTATSAVLCGAPEAQTDPN